MIESKMTRKVKPKQDILGSFKQILFMCFNERFQKFETYISVEFLHLLNSLF